MSRQEFAKRHGFRVLGFRVLGFRVLGFRVLGFRISTYANPLEKLS